MSKMKAIISDWESLNRSLCDSELDDYNSMMDSLIRAQAIIEGNATKINGDIVTGDNKEIPERCSTCKYNVKNQPYGTCACVRSEYFTECTGIGRFEGCDKWEDARK
jgi:flavodoxin